MASHLFFITAAAKDSGWRAVLNSLIPMPPDTKDLLSRTFRNSAIGNMSAEKKSHYRTTHTRCFSRVTQTTQRRNDDGISFRQRRPQKQIISIFKQFAQHFRPQAIWRSFNCHKRKCLSQKKCTSKITI